ncbi:MAG: hypothetical protein HYX72_05045 [Acidobacteria bacterium]|nr:hypothetical protein [Acidobacteriota bacterium]
MSEARDPAAPTDAQPLERTQAPDEPAPRTIEKYYYRFRVFHRITHGCVMISFLGLAATGMPLRFNQAVWANRFSQTIGGFGAIRFFHLVFAVVLTMCFLLHLGYIFHLVFIKKERGIFSGPSTLVPQWNDARDLYQHFKWFLGLGPKPLFARFTYWEKFDYWAVFWGMAIIGTSGYVMWLSTFFAKFLPGWLFNVALLIHADEALLAVWFVFAIHFFNSHLRPEEFPMDLVILTGRVNERKFRTTRAVEYSHLVEQGKLSAFETTSPEPWLKLFGRIVGFTVISLGLFLFGLTLWSFLNE